MDSEFLVKEDHNLSKTNIKIFLHIYNIFINWQSFQKLKSMLVQLFVEY